MIARTAYMKHMRKTWMAVALCAAALTFGACGGEEKGGGPDARSTPDIRIGSGSAGQEGGSLSAGGTSDFEYVEEDGKIIITQYIGTDKEVMIPSRIDGKDVTALQYYSFYERDVTKVVCPDTLVSIGMEAFAYCGELEEVKLNEGLREIGASAFMYCASLERVSIPSTVVFIDELGFAGSGIKELEFLCGSAEEWGAGVFDEIGVVEQTISASVAEIETRVFEYASPELVLIVEPGSYAESYAKENGIAYVNASLSKKENSANSKEDSVVEDGIAKRIKEVEEYCHVKFPDSYIRFIEEYNVGMPEANTFQTEGGDDYVINQFLGFVEDFQNSPLGEYDIAVVMAPIDTYLTDDPDLIGAELIPVARLTTDDYVCLNFKDDKEEPGVCVWSCMESEEFHPVIYKVADSFLEFIESLE